MINDDDNSDDDDDDDDDDSDMFAIRIAMMTMIGHVYDIDYDG